MRLQGKLDEALVAHDRAIKLDPSHVEGYDFRATVWQSKGNNDRAIADYGLSIRVDPTYAPAYYRRGYLYQTMGQLDRAKEDYNSSLALPAKNRIGEWAHEQARARLSELAKGGGEKK